MKKSNYKQIFAIKSSTVSQHLSQEKSDVIPQLMVTHPEVGTGGQ